MSRSPASLDSLSVREREIFEFMVRGLTNPDIASALELSANTVKTHVSNILRKLDVSTRTEAVGLSRFTGSPSLRPQIRPVPAIAVMPFRQAQQTTEEERQSDGLVDDLITGLGRRWFPVIARCSTYALYAQGVADARDVGARLSSRFLVEGSYRLNGPRVCVDARLIDTENGHIIWAQRYERSIDDLFEIEFELSSAVISAVETALIDFVAAEAIRTALSELTPWELAVQGMSLSWKGTHASTIEARDLFLRALKGAPTLRLALYGYALSYQRVIVEQWETDVRALVGALGAASTAFSDAHPNDAWARLVAAYASIYRGDRATAEDNVGQALLLEPSSLRGRSLHGQLLAMRGEGKRAIEQLGLALRISPCAPSRWTLECAIALSHFAEGEYESGVHWAQRAALVEGAGVMPFGVLASSLAQLGDRPAAKLAMGSLLARSPGFRVEQFKHVIASTRPDIAERFMEGLQLAGEN